MHVLGAAHRHWSLLDLPQLELLLFQLVSRTIGLQFSATDILARAPMKGAAKCDNRCELQNSVNQWPLERALRSWDMPESMSASVLLLSFSAALVIRSSVAACFCKWHWHAKYQVLLAVVTDQHLMSFQLAKQKLMCVLNTS